MSQEERTRRDRAAVLFAGWLLISLSLTPPQLSTLPSAAGQVLSEFGRDLFACGGPRYLFVQSILGFADEYPFIRMNLKSAWDTDRQWQRREPVTLTAPCPTEVAHAIFSLCLIMGWFKVGAYVMLCFKGVLRGIEGRLLRRADISLPSDRGGRRPARVYIRIIDPKMRRRGAQVEHVYFDCFLMVLYLEWLLRDMSPSTVIFPWTRDTLKRRWDYLLTVLKIPAGRLSVNSLRGGGSVALSEESDDIWITQWKGRWGDQKVLAHYLQTGLADFLLSELPKETVSIITWLESLWGACVLRVVT